MFRLVYRPSLAWATVYATALVVWIVLLLSAFRILERPPAEVIVLLVPAGALATFLGMFLRGPVRWEVDEQQVRRVVGDRTIAILLMKIARATGTLPTGSKKAYLEIVALDGTSVIDLQEGAGLSRGDLRAFYEAVAWYLNGHLATVTNPFGWQATSPPVPERRAAGHWFEPGDFVGHLAYSLITGGLPLLAGGGLGRPWLTVVGILFIAAGFALVAASWRLRLRSPAKAP